MAYENPPDHVPASDKIEAHSCDVLVVGKGNAALCAALAARDGGARVTIIEAAPDDESGGNSRFAGGVMRFQYDSVRDLQRVCDIPEAEAHEVDWDSNTTEEFYDDLFKVTSFRTDPKLSEILVTRSLDAMVWLRSQGVSFVPNYRNQSVVIDGKRKFFGRFPLWV
jgi:tricarballylate dehydrogenase